MIISRIGAYLFLCLMIMVIGVEGLRALEGESAGWVRLSQVIDFIFLSGTDETVTTESGNFVYAILKFPAIYTFMIVSLLLFIISRKRKR